MGLVASTLLLDAGAELERSCLLYHMPELNWKIRNHARPCVQDQKLVQLLVLPFPGY